MSLYLVFYFTCSRGTTSTRLLSLVACNVAVSFVTHGLPELGVSVTVGNRGYPTARICQNSTRCFAAACTSQVQDSHNKKWEYGNEDATFALNALVVLEVSDLSSGLERLYLSKGGLFQGRHNNIKPTLLKARVTPCREGVCSRWPSHKDSNVESFGTQHTGHEPKNIAMPHDTSRRLQQTTIR